MKRSFFKGWVGLAGLFFFSSFGHAGVFEIPTGVVEGRYSGGVEPELQLTEEAAAGINAHLVYGVAESVKVSALMGNAQGNRGFRIGGRLTFDLFPDTVDQPGVGVANQLLYINYDGGPALEWNLIPYLAKGFELNGNRFAPFMAVPFGYRFAQDAIGGDRGLVGFALGSSLSPGGAAAFQFLIEMGVAINNTQTYVSGGVVFAP